MSSTPINALLDSGVSSFSFVDHVTAHNDPSITIITLNNPVSLELADGSPSGLPPITQAATFIFTIGGHKEQLVAYVTDLGYHKLILGLPWIQKHHLRPNWNTGLLAFEHSYCLKHCTNGHLIVTKAVKFVCAFDGNDDAATEIAMTEAPTTPPHDSVTSTNSIELCKSLATDNSEAQYVRTAKHTKRTQQRRERRQRSRHNHKATQDREQEQTISHEEKNSVLDNNGKLGDIHRIGANGFHMHAKRGETTFRTTLADLDHIIYLLETSRKPTSVRTMGNAAILCETKATRSDQDFMNKWKDAIKPEDKVPKEYHDYLDVFNRKDSEKLPPFRQGVDHAIDLEPGKRPIWGPLYTMTLEENKALKEYLDKELGKGFIRSSTSPASSPVMFVKKPGGGLRFCVDYLKLNDITIKNRYPLPLIRETLDNLSKAKVFTKLDIISAFNRI